MIILQLEVHYTAEKYPENFVDDFRKLVDSHPEVNLVELKCVAGTSSPQSVDLEQGSTSFRIITLLHCY